VSQAAVPSRAVTTIDAEFDFADVIAINTPLELP
jgi:hypothetical protein